LKAQKQQEKVSDGIGNKLNGAIIIQPTKCMASTYEVWWPYDNLLLAADKTKLEEADY
jgi:hypothetical protein